MKYRLKTDHEVTCEAVKIQPPKVVPVLMPWAQLRIDGTPECDTVQMPWYLFEMTWELVPDKDATEVPCRSKVFTDDDLVHIDVGGCVVLNSGGPLMRIVGWCDDAVLCAWASGVDTTIRSWFPAACVSRLAPLVSVRKTETNQAGSDEPDSPIVDTKGRPLEEQSESGRAVTKDEQDRVINHRPTRGKPPPGIIPERLHKERRTWDLIECLARHRSQQSVPGEWFGELRRLLDDTPPTSTDAAEKDNPAKPRRCGECRFWLRLNRPSMNGHCRRHPVFQIRCCDDWCGEFEGKE